MQTRPNGEDQPSEAVPPAPPATATPPAPAAAPPEPAATAEPAPAPGTRRREGFGHDRDQAEARRHKSRRDCYGDLGPCLVGLSHAVPDARAKRDGGAGGGGGTRSRERTAVRAAQARTVALVESLVGT